MDSRASVQKAVYYQRPIHPKPQPQKNYHYGSDGISDYLIGNVFILTRSHILSNYYKFQLKIYDQEFNDCIRPYHWKKAVDLERHDIAQEIIALSRVSVMKIVSKLDKKASNMWEDKNARSVMMELLQAKAQQCAKFRDVLLKTENFTLADATVNKFWSIGIDENEIWNYYPPLSWKGQNVLGELLMNVRANLRGEIAPSPGYVFPDGSPTRDGHRGLSDRRDSPRVRPVNQQYGTIEREHSRSSTSDQNTFPKGSLRQRGQISNKRHSFRSNEDNSRREMPENVESQNSERQGQGDHKNSEDVAKSPQNRQDARDDQIPTLIYTRSPEHERSSTKSDIPNFPLNNANKFRQSEEVSKAEMVHDKMSEIHEPLQNEGSKLSDQTIDNVPKSDPAVLDKQNQRRDGQNFPGSGRRKKFDRKSLDRVSDNERDVVHPKPYRNSATQRVQSAPAGAQDKTKDLEKSEEGKNDKRVFHEDSDKSFDHAANDRTKDSNCVQTRNQRYRQNREERHNSMGQLHQRPERNQGSRKQNDFQSKQSQKGEEVLENRGSFSRKQDQNGRKRERSPRKEKSQSSNEPIKGEEAEEQNKQDRKRDGRRQKKSQPYKEYEKGHRIKDQEKTHQKPEPESLNSNIDLKKESNEIESADQCLREQTSDRSRDFHQDNTQPSMSSHNRRQTGMQDIHRNSARTKHSHRNTVDRVSKKYEENSWTETSNTSDYNEDNVSYMQKSKPQTKAEWLEPMKKQQELEKIVLKNVPQYIGNPALKRFLQNHGIKLSGVIKMQQNAREKHKGAYSDYTERVCFGIKPFLVLPVSASIEGHNISIYHDSQKVCIVCKSPGHRQGSQDCPAYLTCDIENVIPFQGQNDTMSNFYPCSLNIYGRQFKSSEHAYQWKKAKELGYDTLANKIYYSRHAGEAKRLSKDIVTEKSEEWEHQRINVMREILRQKAKDCSEFRTLLELSGTKILAEATSDRFWATGLFKSDTLRTDPKFWPGRNTLGVMLDALRSQILTGELDKESESDVKTEDEVYGYSPDLDEEDSNVEQEKDWFQVTDGLKDSIFGKEDDDYGESKWSTKSENDDADKQDKKMSADEKEEAGSSELDPNGTEGIWPESHDEDFYCPDEQSTSAEEHQQDHLKPAELWSTDEELQEKISLKRNLDSKAEDV